MVIGAGLAASAGVAAFAVEAIGDSTPDTPGRVIGAGIATGTGASIALGGTMALLLRPTLPISRPATLGLALGSISAGAAVGLLTGRALST